MILGVLENWAFMSILVTGGAGYIGSVVVEDLIASGVDVVVIDNLSRGSRGAVSADVKFYEGDIGDRALIRRVCSENQIEAVMHFSAYAYVGESVQEPGLYYRNNVVQTSNLLDALLAENIKHFVFSSTCATYGEPKYVPIDENHSQQPANPYGWTKFFVEQMLRDYAKAYDFRFVAFRYFNACGATDLHGEQHEPETHLIPLVLDVALGSRSHITVFGDDYPTPDGTCIRDYIHVSDLSQAHLLGLQHLQNGGKSEFVNLGNGTGFSVLQIIEAVRRVTGKDIEMRIGKRRAGDPSSLVGNATKAKTLLGWEPRIAKLETIIESAWKWHSKSS